MHGWHCPEPSKACASTHVRQLSEEVQVRHLFEHAKQVPFSRKKESLTQEKHVELHLRQLGIFTVHKEQLNKEES